MSPAPVDPAAGASEGTTATAQAFEEAPLLQGGAAGTVSAGSLRRTPGLAGAEGRDGVGWGSCRAGLKGRWGPEVSWSGPLPGRGS